MKKSIKEFQSGIRDILLTAMIDPQNKFNKKEYFILSKLLWGIDNYPQFGIPYTRFGVMIDYKDHYYEMVIRFEDDILVLSKEGAERTPMGSDSFERIYLMLNHKEVFELVKSKQEIDFSDVFEWYSETKELMSLEDVTYTIEALD
jgi:hypothetical protein